MVERIGPAGLGCGSQFEAIFNQAKVANGSRNRFPEWSLAKLIDVACEVGVLKLDYKNVSHESRDFRNYIHPRLQLISGFTPDEHIAKVCLQVLEAAPGEHQ